jgi:hypothetical protein
MGRHDGSGSAAFNQRGERNGGGGSGGDTGPDAVAPGGTHG